MREAMLYEPMAENMVRCNYCYACGAVAIERSGLSVIRNRLYDGKCPECGAQIDGDGL